MISNQRVFTVPSVVASLPCIGNDSEYVPLLTLYRPFEVQVYKNDVTDEGIKERVDHLTREGHTKFEEILTSKICNARINTFEYYKDLLSEVRESIVDWVKDENLDFQVRKTRCTNSNYDGLIGSFLNEDYWIKHELRTKDYITNFWFLSELGPNDKVKPLFSMMVKKEHVPYVRMCYLLNQTPHPEALQLWIREDFDVPRSEYKGLRPKYRKFIKTLALEAGHEIVTKPTLNDMFASITIPKFKRLNERKDWMKGQSTEFLQHYIVSKDLESVGVELVV